MRKLFVGLMIGVLMVAAMALPAIARHGDPHPAPPPLELDVVYVSQWTGQVYAVQVPSSFPVSEADDNPTTFCVSVWTAQLRWFGGTECFGRYTPVVVDWSGDFDVCLNEYTQELRAFETSCPFGYVARVI